MNPEEQQELTKDNNKSTVLTLLGKKYVRLYEEGMSISEARAAIEKYNDYYEELILRTLGPDSAHLYRKDMKLDEAMVLQALREYTHLYVAGMTLGEACDAARDARHIEREIAYERQLQAERDAQAESYAKDV